MNTIARIGYFNTLPFFHGWPSDKFPLLSGSPAELARAANEGEILAGPLPVVETWKMADVFEPLSDFGIGTEKESRSVFLVSQTAPDKFSGMVGLTAESATSAALLRVLMKKRWNASAVFHKEFLPEDTGRLLIGDTALRIWMDNKKSPFPVITDLASAWTEWKKKGFVFARWVVRKDAPAEVKKELARILEDRLEANLKTLDRLCDTAAEAAGLSPARLEEYLRGFHYHLGPNQKAGEKEFKEEWQELNAPAFI